MASLKWDGLEEYREELKQLSDVCKAEAGALIEENVNGAYVTISQFYGAHRVTGTLQKGLRIKTLKGGLELRSDSPLAGIFDNGTQARHYFEISGVKHLTGRMPATHIFSRTVERARQKLAQQYKEMLLRHGAASVTDD